MWMTLFLTVLMLLICIGTGIFGALCLCALLAKWISDDDDWEGDDDDFDW